jgi:hypothetical protein
VANGCCAAASLHRAIRIPVGGAQLGKQETLAIDWVQLRDGKLVAADGSSARPGKVKCPTGHAGDGRHNRTVCGRFGDVPGRQAAGRPAATG